MIKGKFYLKPVDKNAPSKDCIILPDGKTTIGRGPFLQCAEKRISRNHATVEVKDGALFITPIHVNPCFHHGKGGKGIFTVMPKDKPYKLKSGDRISLLPDSSMYDVINESEDSSNNSLENGISDTEPEAKELPDVTAASNNLSPEKEGKSSKRVINSPDESKSKATPQSETSTRRRTLPEWMLDAASDDADNGQRPVSKAKKAKPKAASTKKGKKSTSKARKTCSEDESLSPSEDDEKDLAMPAKSKKVNKRNAEHEISEDDEMPVKAKNAKKKVVKRETSDEESDVSTPATSKKVNKRNADREISDDEEDDYTPKKAKNAKKKVVKRETDDEEEESDEPVKAKNAKKKVVKRETDDEEEEGDEPVKPKKTKKLAAEQEMSDDEQAGEEKSSKVTSKKPKPTPRKRKDSAGDDGAEDKKRKSCEFGKKCYRRNKAHLEEFSHPGDDDYTSEQEPDDAGGSGSEDDRPECEFGTDCYRKNRQHKKQFKHTVRPQRRAAREATRKTSYREKGSDEDSLESSFVDDDDSNDDSSYSPDDEDIRTLKKEAKDFVKNKRMYQLRS